MAVAEKANSVHRLRYLLHEDEAQMTGYRFSVHGSQVEVQTTFLFPEYEPPPRMLSVTEARKLWKSLMASGHYEPLS